MDTLSPPRISSPGVVAVEGSFGFRKSSLCAKDANWLFVLNLSRAAQELSNKYKDSPSTSYSTPELLLPMDMMILHSRESSPCIINNDCLGCFERKRLIQPRTNETVYKHDTKQPSIKCNGISGSFKALTVG